MNLEFRKMPRLFDQKSEFSFPRNSNNIFLVYKGH